ncbi:putative late blight resistance protein homolog R1A-10 isoform X1 [Salvia miltiorrhiza]|uniref:putative late blight resistance protein homolog R1A-10 isoform X1 n=1 Tax=Salvia miltiorrhiza TaxID=226208 RepID=UPI0025AC32CD|nr:putative late blight resistance protein homolog R1A-10 isoform X1 [Salvia miltiorrhiza]
MAYAAVISLMNTIEGLRNSSRISFDVTPCPEIIEPAYEELKSLQEILKRLDGSSKSSIRMNALDAQIRDAVSQFEDKLESHISNQFLSQSDESIDGDESHPLVVSIDLQDLRLDFCSFVEMAKRMEEEYVDQLINMTEEEEDDDDEVVSSRIDFSGNKLNTKMVGFSDLFGLIKDGIMGDEWFRILAIVGMAGIGKTTLVNEIFQDKMVLSRFERCAWVKVGRKFQLHEIARNILAQVKHPVTDEEISEKGVSLYLKEILKKKRCLIVLDDVWDRSVWDYLRSSFPYGYEAYDPNPTSQILLTTRLQQVANAALQANYDGMKEMRFLNKEESWDLLRDKVFGEDPCPLKLEKVGQKIAENCEGLPLLIVRVADLLSKAEKTPEYWNKVAEKRNSVFVDAYDQILEVLYPSYEYLPQHLKACFLYMGVFPQNYEIPRSKLINMWIAEGTFLEPSMLEKSEYHAVNYLNELISNSLVSSHRATCWWFVGQELMKTISIHSALGHMATKIARMNNFFHVLSSRFDGLEEDMEFQRRLCIHNNILFGIRELYESVGNDSASIARSLLCLGPFHRYPVPVYVNSRLLRVLDALNIRFYEFPLKVLKLVRLKYLALTYNGDLPTSISKLRNLQFLIIHRHTSIHSCGSLSSSYVPLEIWDMQELKHIEVLGSNLPNSNASVSLEKLSKLLGVSAYSCTKGVLERISNLKKLGIQIELVVDDDNSELFGRLNSIGSLRNLDSLKCVVVNPEMRCGVIPPPAPRSMFPPNLRKLTLSGLGYPWEYMSILAKLGNLSVLKLQCYAFQGPRWEIKEDEPFTFGFLQIEDTDLAEWKVAPGGMPCIRKLSIKHCYNLEELNWEPDNYVISKIEVVDCNPSLVARVNQIEAAQLARQYPNLSVSLHSSWDDAKRRSTPAPVESKKTFWDRVPLHSGNLL